jgi:hypothetical protein
MNQQERDYLIARAVVGGLAEEAVKLFAVAVMIVVGLWVLGVFLMYWWLILPLVFIVALVSKANSEASAHLIQTLTTARASMPTDVPNVRGSECAIRTADGQFIAPDLDTLVQWVRERRVPPQSYVFTCDFGAWRIAYDIEQLVPAFKPA